MVTVHPLNLDSLLLLWPWAVALVPLPWLFRRRFGGAAALRLPRLLVKTLPDGGVPRSRWSVPKSAALWPWLAWLLLVFACTRPAYLEPSAGRPVSGRDLTIAFDVSASMATVDMRRADGQAISRIDAAREVSGAFLGRRNGDRVGLIVFGDRAYRHTPLSFDVEAVRQAIAGIDVGLLGEQTALADAIALAAREQAAAAATQRSLILISDGRRTAGALGVGQAIWLAQRAAMKVHTIGIGADRMRVVDARGFAEVDLSGDLDSDTLRRIAEQTGGSYQRSTDGPSLTKAFADIESSERIEARAADRLAIELYPWLLATSLGLVLVGLGGRAILRRDPLVGTQRRAARMTGRGSDRGADPGAVQ